MDYSLNLQILVIGIDYVGPYIHTIDSNPKRLVEEGEYMVGKIQHIIHKEKPQLFASFREKRLSSYWLFVISKSLILFSLTYIPAFYTSR
jgi:hypothetical protein